MTLAAYTDANQWLDENKLSFSSDQDAAPEAKQADNVVRAALITLYPDHANLWDKSPTGLQEQTPALVVTITSLFMASYRYAKAYSEEALDPNSYSSMLEARAKDLILQLSQGSMSLGDVAYPAGTDFSEADFWPNDTDVDSTNKPNRKFNMKGPDFSTFGSPIDAGR